MEGISFSDAYDSGKKLSRVMKNLGEKLSDHRVQILQDFYQMF